jgi:twitching motility protein PilJ
MSVHQPNTLDAQEHPSSDSQKPDPLSQAYSSSAGQLTSTTRSSGFWPMLKPSSLSQSALSSSNQGVSIRTKAAILAILFSVLPILVVSWVAYRLADNSIIGEITEERLGEANQIAEGLNRHLQERLADMLTIAGTDVNTAFNSDGTIAGKVNSAEREEILNTIQGDLTAFVQHHRTYTNIALYDLRGNVIVQSKGSTRELNQKQAPYFQQILQTNAPVISEPIASQGGSGSERLAIYVAAPVQDADKTTVAIVAGKIPVDWIGTYILKSKAENVEETHFLVDSNGYIFQNVPGSNSALIGQSIADLLPVFAQANSQQKPQSWLGKANLPEQLLKINAQRQQQSWLLGGLANEQLHIYAPVPSISNLQWGVITSIDASAAFVAQQRLLQTFTLGIGVTAIVMVVLSVAFARKFTSPIRQIAHTVEKLGQGNLETRVVVQGNDELAVLGATINQMANQIQSLLQTVRRNAEQLSQQNEILVDLAQTEALIQGDAQAAAKAFTEAIAQTLVVERVSIWVYNNQPVRLVCLDDYYRSQHRHHTGNVLEQENSVEYFLSLDTVIAAENASTHSAIQPLFAAAHIAPDTCSLLQVPIQVAGTTIGIIRCEHIQDQRIWQAEEQAFVSSVATLMSVAMESEFLQQEVSHLLDVVSEVEEGDLTTQANVSDRTTGLVADTFNRLIERLTAVISQVVDTARRVSRGANLQKAMAATVATNTRQQAQAVERVLQFTEQVEHMAQSSTEKVTATTASLKTMQLTVESGQQAIAILIEGIGVLQEGTNRIIQQMKTLGEFVGLADQFVQDQSQIASLTQTLALNASLVAARASEQRDPRQFAVVAREFDAIAGQISRLAQQTNESLLTLEQRSAQIHTVVAVIDTNIQNLGGLVRGFTQGVDQSQQIFGSVQTVTQEVVAAGDGVAQANQEIVEAAQVSAQVVRDIAAIATQTAELSQQTQLHAEEMDTLSTQLLQTIAFFRLPNASDASLPTNAPLVQPITVSVNATTSPEPSPAQLGTADYSHFQLDAP